MQLLVSSQMEAGMEEVLDEMVVGVQKGNNWVQGGNIRQAGQGAPPGNGVCTVCTIRYTEMTQIKLDVVLQFLLLRQVGHNGRERPEEVEGDASSQCEQLLCWRQLRHQQRGLLHHLRLLLRNSLESPPAAP